MQIDDDNVINLDQIVRLVSERSKGGGPATTKIVMSDGASITASGTIQEVLQSLEESLDPEEEEL